MSVPAESDIRAFWVWFESVSCDLAEDFDNEELVAALDTRVAELGNFEWELGPGATRPNALVISPGGDPELLRATRKVVSKAPAITGWEFLHARHPRQWQMRFTIEDRSGAVRQVDASGWCYVLLRYPDGAHEVIIEAPSMAEFDEELRYSAAIVVLDGLLGEERRLEAVDEVSIVPKLEGEHASKARDLAEIIRAFVLRH